jgi:hypothetical protein
VQLVKSRLSLAFFDLVSKIFLDTPGSGPTVGDRTEYAREAIECWVRCVAVAVEYQVTVRSLLSLFSPLQKAEKYWTSQNWRPYLGYGDQSAKRISDPLGRRDVGLYLIVEILKHDPTVYAVRSFMLPSFSLLPRTDL